MEHIKEKWGLILILFFSLSSIFTFLILKGNFFFKKEIINQRRRSKPGAILYNYHRYNKIKMSQFDDLKGSEATEETTIEHESTHEAPKKSFIYHKVEKGDTLWKIAKLYQVNIDNLIFINQLDNPDLIFQGSILRIK